MASAFSRARFSDGFFEIVPEFHFPENALALHLLFQRFEGLIDVVVANEYLHPATSFGVVSE